SDKRFFAKELDVYDHGGYIECAPKSCTKSGAMLDTLEYIGIKKENSIAIGDSVNDMDMLKNAGIAVAMGNAIECVKEIADFVSTPCIDGGVGYALEKLILKKINRKG
ncbi:MAG: HAD hydrolase family protein, partial [Clostridia bacterium]|nr:HAD hydrolase family protein [Clostridia bacterium]